MTARVIAVSRDGGHRFSKVVENDRIVLVEGRGVEGDAHSGETDMELSLCGSGGKEPCCLHWCQ
jgi:hypothetical protein